MNYQHEDTKEIKTYEEVKAVYSNSSIPPDGTIEILSYHVIAATSTPVYDVYTEGVREIAPVDYTQTWEIYDLTQLEIDELDITNRDSYEYNMNRVMIGAQSDALGDPAIHRYTQAMTKYYQMTEPYSQDELDFRASAEDALAYQEDNAVKYDDTVDALAPLTGAAIVDYAMPDFTPDAGTINLDIYLAYLKYGYAK